ncbi:MAG: PorV/PorQ family protein [Endomicrobiaceae bacterium]|nr:PorV/PorQ family protein [Endomicrobiaceae bacterium]
MNKIKSLIITFIFILFSCINAQAFFSKDDIGSTTAQFLKLGIGAKSAGMGNAVTSVYNGTEAIYWNPANLNYIDRKELSFSHTIWFEDVNYEWLAFVLPTEEYGVFGFGLQYVSYGSIDKFDNTNTFDGSFSPMDMALYLSYANSYEKVDFGLNLKYIYSKIEESASAIGLDLGAKYTLDNNKTSFGATITNFGTNMRYNKESESLPFLFKIGASHYIVDMWLVSLDLNFPKDNEIYFNLGTEYTIEIADNLRFDLRAGYEGRNKDIPGFNWINLGFGLEYLDYIFDYAFVPYGDIGMTHRFSFSIRFGRQVEKKDLSVR